MSKNILDKINPVIVNFIRYKTDKKYKRTIINKKILKKIIIPPEVEEFNKDININNFHKKFRPYIEEFVQMLKENFDEDVLDNFYRNIESLQITEEMNENSTLEGKYVIKNNTIVIYNNISGSTIFHELFHMASSNNIDKSRNFVGFHQYSFPFGDCNLGKGINEGYTEHLTQKYFKEETYMYDFEVFMASYIENIIGFDKMSKLYFKSNIKGLINEMSQYESEDNVVTFLKCLDYYNRNSKDKNSRKYVCICVDFCIEFVFKSYLNYLRKMYDNNLMTQDEVIDNINQIYDEMCFDLFDEEEHFELYFDSFVEEVESVFNDILSIKEVNI